jgi:DNA-binding response OmpR family regulator
MSRRILLIDDDRDDRDLFCEALGTVAPAIACDCAPDGMQALKKLESQEAVLPDVIFLDINLPIISGWQCLNMLKKTDTLQHIPVIIYTTSSHERDKKIAKDFGALTFFTKPHDFDELKKSLRIVTEHIERDAIAALNGKDLSA